MIVRLGCDAKRIHRPVRRAGAVPGEVPVLKADFFNCPAEEAARKLIGKYLVRRIDGKIRAHRITETEAYVGPHDLACHVSKGRTKRTEAMFGPPMSLYVYFCYGMHWMLNVVVREEGYPAAVLIRGVEGVDGPGRITKALSVTGALHGAMAVPQNGLWFEDRGEKARQIEKMARVGIGYAKGWAKKKLRFVIKETRQAGLRGRRRAVS